MSKPTIITGKFWRLLRQSTGFAMCGLVSFGQVAPAFADVIPTSDGAGGTVTDTTVAATGDITTGTIVNGGAVGLNAFSEFDIDAGESFTLIQPSGTDALVNVVDGTSASRVAGTLNMDHADAGTRSNVFIVDHNGFIVSGAGVVNAENLTISTATQAFGADLVAGDAGAIATLFSGSEPLAASTITVETAAAINATGLSLRSGAAMVLDGTITVSDPAAAPGGTVTAVNTEGRPQATGVSVQDGVIRFGAGTDIEVSGTVSAARGTGGGEIVMAAGGALRLRSGTVLDVSGTDDAGAVIAFTDGSAILESGVRIDATSVAGAGGFAFLKSVGDFATATGADTSTIEIEGTAALLEGASVSIDNDIATAGGDLALLGDSVTIDAALATNADSAGDLIVAAPDITVAAGSSLTAEGATAGGLVALIANDVATGTVWSISDTGAASAITITDATLSGGAVVVSATAQSTNLVTEDDVEDAEDLNDVNYTDIDAAFNAAETMLRDAIEDQLLALDARSPLAIEALDARAVVNVSGSSLTSDGSWIGPIAPVAGAADNGVLSADGLALLGYALPGLGPVALALELPANLDPAGGDVFVQSYAETNVDVDTGDKALSATIVRAERTSAVIMDDVAVTAAGAVDLASLAQDNLSISTQARDVDGNAIGGIYATSHTDNQLVVNGGSLDAGGLVTAQALTGKTHDLRNEVRSATGARGAAAVTVAISSGTTEAVVSGVVNAASATVNAETLYFNKSSVTNATTGTDEDLAETDETTQSDTANRTGAYGDDASDETADEDSGSTSSSAAYGLAVDVALDQDTTRAVLGGTYTDLGLTGGLVSDDTATVTLAGALNVTATQRFARADEGGAPLTRNVHALMGDIDDGASGNFAAASVASMRGTVLAEVGSGATVDADTVDVSALTSYREYGDAGTFRSNLAGFVDDITETSMLGGLDAGEVLTYPDIEALLDPAEYLTSSTGTKTLQPDGEDQTRALGFGVTYVNLNNDTTAVIRGGANVTTTANTDVMARAEGVFFHDAPNAAEAEPVEGEDPTTPGDTIGGSLVFARTTSAVNALVEDGAVLDVAGLGLDARQDFTQLARTVAGGAAGSKSINAGFGAQVLTTDTVARLGGGADVTAADVTIAAEDASQVVTVAGTNSESESKAAGASIAVNIINRDTWAGIGAGGAAGVTALDADSLTVTARNTGLAFAATRATTKVAGTPNGSTGASSNDEDARAPNHLMRSNERTAIDQQRNRETPADQGGTRRRTGWAISGAASLNLLLNDAARAEVATAGRVVLTGDLSVLATSTTDTLAIGGAAFQGQGGTAKTNGLAGAFAVNAGDRTIEARLTGGAIEADGADVQAVDQADNVAVATGAGRTARDGMALAGSVGFIYETGRTGVTVDADVTTAGGAQSYTATNDAQLMGLGGAGGANLSLRGNGFGVGFGLVTSDRETALDIADGATLEADALSLIAGATTRVVSVGASIGAGRTGGAGSVSINTLLGDVRTRVGTSGGAGADLDAGTLTLRATDAAQIRSLAGAAAVGRSRAVGLALSVNTITTQTELAVLNSRITSNAGAFVMESAGTSDIRALAAGGAVGTSGLGVTVGATVNTIAADTRTRFEGSSLSADSATFTARNDRSIRSLSGAATLTGSSAAGFAIASNVLAGNETLVSLDGAAITTTGALTATATTASAITARAAGLSVGTSTSGNASVAVGVIETQTRAQAAGAALDVGGTLALNAVKAADVDTLAGSIAISTGRTAVGGAVVVNVIRDTVTSDLATDAAVDAGAISVTATNGGRIDARALSAGASGSNAANASIIYSQIGARSDAALVPGTAGTEGGADPALSGQTTATAERDAALADLSAVTGTTYDLTQEDLTRARVELGAGTVTTGALTVTASETAVFDTFAGGVSGAGSNAGGFAVNLSLLFGRTEADVVLAEGSTVTLDAPLTVTATQGATLDLDAAAGSGAGKIAGAGSIIVTVADRSAFAGVRAFDGADASTDVDRATLRTLGSDATIRATQSGSLDARAGAAALAGSAAIGGAVIVNVLADDALVSLADVTLNQRIATPGPRPLEGAGDLTLAARNDLSAEVRAYGLGLSSRAAFAGSVAVTHLQQSTTAQVLRSNVRAGAAEIRADALAALRTRANSAAASGSVAGGAAVVTNVGSADVLADLDNADVRTHGALRVISDMDLDVRAGATAAGVSGSAAVTGSAIANDMANSARVMLRDTGALGATRLLSRGSVAVLSQVVSDYQLGGGLDLADGFTNISAGGTAGVGATVVVNLSRNVAETVLTDAVAVDGFGFGTVSAGRLGVVRGVGIDAYARTDVDLASVNLAAGGTAAGAVTLAYNTLSDQALTRVGAGSSATVGGLQAGGNSFYASLGTFDVHSGQDAIVSARAQSTTNSFVGTGAFAGSGGVGASSTINLVTSRAEVAVQSGQIWARDDVSLSSDAVTTITPNTLGLAASGGGSVAASVNYAEVASTSLITLEGAVLEAGRNGGAGSLRLRADAANDVDALTGNLAAGVGAGAGSFQVNKLNSRAAITVAAGTALQPVLSGDPSAPVVTFETVALQSDLTASEVVDLTARTTNTTDIDSVTGAGGGFAGGFGANVTLITSTSEVLFGAGQEATGDDIALSALEVTNLRGRVGVGSVGGTSIGGSLDYLHFGGDAKVEIGVGATLTAADDLTLTADARRDIDSQIGVVSVGGTSIAAAVSVIEVGGAANDASGSTATMLGSVEGSLNATSASAQSDQLVARAGGGNAAAVAAQQGANVNAQATRVDDVGVAVSSGAELRAGGDLTLAGQVQVDVDQDVGVATASAGSLSASVGVVKLSNTVGVTTGSGAELAADGAVALRAISGDADASDGVTYDVRSRVANLGLASTGALNAGLSFVDNTSTVDVTLNGATRVQGAGSAAAGSLSMNAERREVTSAQTFNVALAGALAIGVSRSEVNNGGLARVRILGTGGAFADLTAANVNMAATDLSRATSDAIGATGGVIAGNGVEAVARNAGRNIVTLNRFGMQATTVTVDSTASGRVVANASGLALGGIAVGVTLAEATFAQTMHTSLNGARIDAVNIAIRTQANNAQGTNAVANARAAAGGLAAGAGTRARAYTGYDLRTDVRGVLGSADATSLTSSGNVVIGTSADSISADAMATGLSIGGVAVGVVLAEVGQAGGRVGSVQTHVHSGGVGSIGDVTIYARNTQNLNVDVTAGSGGLASGSGSNATTIVNARTLTTTGQEGIASLIAGDVEAPEQSDGILTISATQATDLASDLDNTNASLIGFSGARTLSDLDYDTDVIIGAGTRTAANRIDIAASHDVRRPAAGFNIRSTSGGAFDGVSIDSDIVLNATTDVQLLGGAQVGQLGGPSTYKALDIGVTTNTVLYDRLSLDAGGALALPLGDSRIDVQSNRANVTIGAALVEATGPLNVYTGSSGDVRAEAHATSYGLAGSASAHTRAFYNGTNDIDINAGALLRSLSDISLRAGAGRSGVQSVAVNAESRVFNKTVIPVTLPPVADAYANTTSRITIADGAQVLAYEDIFVEATEGDRGVRGYGLAKDHYLEIIAAILNALGSLFGIDPIVLDIRRGNSTDISDNGVIVNGQLSAGTYNRQTLVIDVAGNLNNGLLGEPDSNADNIDWVMLEDQVLRDPLIARRNALLAELATLDPLDPLHATTQASIIILNDRIAEVGAATNDIVVVNQIYAAEGSIQMFGDYVAGTGSLYAAGDTDVRISVNSGASLNLLGIGMSGNVGGQISVNNRLITSNADVIAASDGARPTSLSITRDLGDNTNLIEIATNSPVADLSDPRDGSIEVFGDLTNDRGNIVMAANRGSVNISALVAGVDVTVTGAKDLNVIYDGTYTVGGDPARGYQDLFRQFEFGANLFRGFLGGYPNYTREIRSGLTPRRSNSGMDAGRNINLVARDLNINSTIQAGTGSYTVTIGAGIDAEIAALRARGGSGRVLLYDTATITNNATPKSPNVSADTNARVYYNFDTGQIEVDDMQVRGGRVRITGNIVSTGTGRIEALDGYGSLVLRSDANTDVVLSSIDLGGTAGGAGLAGLVSITDTSKRTTDGLRFLTTEYRREGGVLTVLNNDSFTTYEDPILGTLTTPTNVVSTSTGRGAIYRPTQNRDYVVTSIYERQIRRQASQSYWVHGDWTYLGEAEPFRLTYTTVADTEVNTQTFLQSAGSIRSSLPGSDYGYAYQTSVSPMVALPPAPTAATLGYLSSMPITGNEYRYLTPFDNYYNYGPLGPTFLWWGGAHFITRSEDITYTEREVRTHRLKADYDIDIYFSGNDAPVMDIQTRGNVILSEAVANGAGSSTITSTNGSILTAGNTVTVSSAGLELRAERGSIRGLGGSFRVDQLAGGALTAVARDEIDITEVFGDLLVRDIRTTGRPGSATAAQTGQLSLTAQGSILQEAGAPDLQGSDITLEAQEGALGAADNVLRIDTEGGVLTATAQDNVWIRETAGDLGLNHVQSLGGAVTLDVPDGSVTDRNDLEERDLRTAEELEALWRDELGLTDDSALLPGRVAVQEANLVAERNADYAAYWDARGAGGPIAYVPSPEVVASLTVTLEDGSTDTSILDAYVTTQEALYAQWNTEVFDPAFDYVLTSEDRAGITAGISWTTAELTRSIRDGLILRTGDTETEVEAPNISAAGDITITARDAVGELLAPYEITHDSVSSGTLTDDDYAVLYGAEAGDITVDDDAGITYIEQEEDLDFAFDVDADGVATGSLRITAAGSDIYLGAETSAGLATLDTSGELQLRINGLMTDDRDAAFAINGQEIVLEAGNDGSIGEAGDPVTVNVLPGGTLTARAGGDVYLEAPVSDLPIAGVFAGDTASLTTPGALTDPLATGLPRVIASDIVLEAGTIGTGAVPFGIEQLPTADGGVSITSTAEGVNLTGYSDLVLDRFESALGGALTLEPGFALTLAGADTVRFDTGETLTLTTAGISRDVGATGVDVTGGSLVVRSTAPVGAEDGVLTTALVALDYAHLDPVVDGSLWLSEVDDLRITGLSYGTNPASVADVAAGGALLIDRVEGTGPAAFRARDVVLSYADVGALDVDATDDLTVDVARVAEAADLTAGRDMLVRDLTAAELVAMAGNDLDITLAEVTAPADLDAGRDMAVGDLMATDLVAEAVRDMTLGQIAAMAALADAGQDVIVTRLDADTFAATAGRDLTAAELAVGRADLATATGDLTARFVDRDVTFGDIVAGADLDVTAEVDVLADAGRVGTGAGDLSLVVDGDLTQAVGSAIDSDTGQLDLTVTGDFIARQVTTGGDALNVTVLGDVSAPVPADPIFAANAAGAPTTLRFGTSAEDSVVGLGINVARLDAEVARGDLHLLEADDLELVRIAALDGDIDLSARGDLRMGAVSAPGGTATLTAGGDLLGAGATADVADLNLFAFAGSITGPGGSFDLDAVDGATLTLFAEDDILLTDATGVLRVGLANAVTGDLTLVADTMDLGLLGTGGTLTLTTQGDLDLNLVGVGQIDLVDEFGLRLIDRGDPRYGLVTLSAPEVLNLTALGDGAEINVHLANVRGSANLRASTVNANLYDPTPTDGLILTVTDPAGEFAFVDVDVIGDGSVGLILDPFDPGEVPLTQRLLAETRPADPTLTGTTGELTVSGSRLAGGEITFAGPVLTVVDTRVSGDVWFRQQLFDLLATAEFTELDPLANAQILARDNLNDPSIAPGEVNFFLAQSGALITANEFVLTRDIELLIINDAPGTLREVLLDQLELLTRGPRLGDESVGRVAATERLMFLLGVQAKGANLVELPFMVSSAAP